MDDDDELLRVEGDEVDEGDEGDDELLRDADNLLAEDEENLDEEEKTEDHKEVEYVYLEEDMGETEENLDEDGKATTKVYKENVFLEEANGGVEDELPDGWSVHKSGNRQGHSYFFHSATGKTVWNKEEVTALETLKEERERRSILAADTESRDEIARLEMLLENKRRDLEEKASNKQDREEKGKKRKGDSDDDMQKVKKSKRTKQSEANSDDKDENTPCKDGTSCRFQRKDRPGRKCLLSHPDKQMGSPTMTSETGSNKKDKERESERKEPEVKLKEEVTKRKKHFDEKKEIDKKEREAARHKRHLKRELEDINKKEEEEKRKKEREKKMKSIEDKVRNDIEKRKKIAEEAIEERVLKKVEEEMYDKIEKEEAIKQENERRRANMVQQAGGAGRGKFGGRNPWLEQGHIGTNLPSNQVFGFHVPEHIGTSVPSNQIFGFGISHLPRIPKKPPKNPNPSPVDISTMLDAAQKHMQNNLEMERRKKEEEKQRVEDRIKKENDAIEVEKENKLQDKDKSKNKLVEERGQKRPPPDLTTPEQGYVTDLKKEFGFLENPKNLDKEIYFHFSSVNEKPEELKVGDEVEYFLHHRKDGRFSANGVKLLSEGTIPKLACRTKIFNGEVVRQLRSMKEDFCGKVMEGNTELEFRFGVSGLINKRKLPKKGDQVYFQISQSENFAMNVKLNDQQEVIPKNEESHGQQDENRLDTAGKVQKLSEGGDKHTLNKRSTIEQGYVSTIKTDFGFIEAEIEKTIFFHQSNFNGQFNELQVGQEVSYSTYQTKDGRVAANDVKQLEEGTIAQTAIKEGALNGRVVRPLRANKTDYHGIVSGHMEDGTQVGEFKFGVVSLLDKQEILRRGEPVSFQSSETGSIALCLKSTKEEEERKRKLKEEQIKKTMEEMKEKKRLEDEIKKEVEQKEREEMMQEEERMRKLVDEQIRQKIEDTKEKMQLEEKIRKEFEQREREAARNKRQLEREEMVKKDKAETETAIKEVEEVEEKKSIEKEKRSIEQVEECLKKRNSEPNPDNEANLKQNVQETKKIEVLETRKCGYVMALKSDFGFIETMELNSGIFFHMSNVDGNPEDLEVGQEVEYKLYKNKVGKVSADSVKVLAENTIPWPVCKDKLYNGKVLKTLRRVNQKHCGLIEANFEELKFKFGIASLINKKDSLREGDFVTFQVSRNEDFAMKVSRQKLISHVTSVKSNFGFISNKLEMGSLIFYMADLDDNQQIQVGDEVEFEATTNLRTKKSSASRVRFLRRPEKQVLNLLEPNMPSTSHHINMASHLTSSEEEPMEEDMEWEVGVEEVVEESQRVRAMVVEEDMEGVLEMPGQEGTEEVPCNLPVVVVDTNVLLHALALVQTLVERAECVVFLTWMVQQELDRHKSGQDRIGFQGREAVRWISAILNTGQVNFKTQSLAHQRRAVREHLDKESRSPDDRILASCLLLKEGEDEVILLTDDVSLANKALANKVRAVSSKEVRLGSAGGNKEERTAEALSIDAEVSTGAQAAIRDLLEVVLVKEFKEAYGESLWSSMVSTAPAAAPPYWTLETLLRLYDKHHIAVFGIAFPGNGRKLLETLYQVKKEIRAQGSLVNEVNEVVKVVALRDQYDGAVDRAWQKIEGLKSQVESPRVQLLFDTVWKVVGAYTMAFTSILGIACPIPTFPHEVDLSHLDQASTTLQLASFLEAVEGLQEELPAATEQKEDAEKLLTRLLGFRGAPGTVQFWQGGVEVTPAMLATWLGRAEEVVQGGLRQLTTIREALLACRARLVEGEVLMA